MSKELESIKQLVGFVFKSKGQLTGYLEDGKISFFEGIGIASIASETVVLVKEVLPQIPITKLNKLTAAEKKQIVDYVIAEFSLTKNKALEAQIKKSIAWLQSTYELINGWKTIKQS